MGEKELWRFRRVATTDLAFLVRERGGVVSSGGCFAGTRHPPWRRLRLRWSREQLDAMADTLGWRVFGVWPREGGAEASWQDLGDDSFPLPLFRDE